jgi:hypothetical protein
MKLLCWLAAGQEENKKQSKRCRLDDDTPSSLTLSYQMKATNKWLYACKYVLFLYSANSCDDNQPRWRTKEHYFLFWTLRQKDCILLLKCRQVMLSSTCIIPTFYNSIYVF